MNHIPHRHTTTPLHQTARRTLPATLRMPLKPITESATFCTVIITLYLVNAHFTQFPEKEHLIQFTQLLIDLYLYSLLLIILPHQAQRWLRGAGYTVMYTLCIVESFLFQRFGMRFCAATFMLCFDTTPTESTEFIAITLHSRATYVVLLTYTTLLLLHLTLAQNLGRRCSLWRRCRLASLRRWRHSATALRRSLRGAGIALAAAFVIGASTGINRWTERQRHIVPYLRLKTSRNAEKCFEINFYSAPLRFVWGLKLYTLVMQETDEMARNTRNLRLDGCTFNCPKIVLIIGESYNKHHASLYGYTLPTTPRQQALADSGRLVRFDDAVTPWNLTSNAFKELLSTHSCNDPGRWNDGVLFPAVMKRAGYYVTFFSNQFYRSPDQSNSDVNSSSFFSRSDVNEMCFSERNTLHADFDGPFIDDVVRPHHLHEHELLIIHLYGQHMNYTFRSPYRETGGAPFGPANYRRTDLSDEQRQTLADYDNAVYFNDTTLASIYEQYAGEDVVFVCLADHGEYIFDGAEKIFGRRHRQKVSQSMARNEFEVPLTLVFTRTFKQLHPDVVNRARAARSLPFATDDLAHLIMGLAGIASPHYDPRHDLLSPDYDASRPRILRGNEDYDKIMGRR